MLHITHNFSIFWSYYHGMSLSNSLVAKPLPVFHGFPTYYLIESELINPFLVAPIRMLASEGSASFSSPCSSNMEPPSISERSRNRSKLGKMWETLWELVGPWWKIEAEILEASSFTVIFLDETADVKKNIYFSDLSQLRVSLTMES